MTVATATQTLEERVEGWANDLCAALEENFKQETIRSHKRQRDEGDSWSKESVSYTHLTLPTKA